MTLPLFQTTTIVSVGVEKYEFQHYAYWGEILSVLGEPQGVLIPLTNGLIRLMESGRANEQVRKFILDAMKEGYTLLYVYVK